MSDKAMQVLRQFVMRGGGIESALSLLRRKIPRGRRSLGPLRPSEVLCGTLLRLWRRSAGRPQPFNGLETVNDKDHFIANFWRALKAKPEALAEMCDWPINETDLHARHLWLVNEGVDKIKACYSKPSHYDLKVAAWWVWGLSQWIGGGWCQSETPWNQRPAIGGKKGERGINKVTSGRPHLARPCGINVQNRRPILSCEHGITAIPEISASNKRPNLCGWADRGVHTKRPSSALHKEMGKREGLIGWFHILADRLRDVRVVCGDWKRVTGPSVTVYTGTCGMFLDPPYTKRTGRDQGLYRTDSGSVGDEVHAWALANGSNPAFRIAVCGYEGEYAFPESWKVYSWKTEGGFGKLVKEGNPAGLKNSERERIWFSPHCLQPQPELF